MRIFKRLTWREIFTIGLVFGVTGCATTANQVFGGKTTLKSTLNTEGQADGTFKDSVNMEASGAAADVVKAITNVSIHAKDSTGTERSLNFGASQDNDATLRGQLYVEAHKDDLEYRRAVSQQVFDTIQMGAQLAAPIFGTHVAAKDANEATKLQNQLQFRSQLLQAAPELAQLNPLLQMLPQLTQFFQNPNVLRLLNGQPVRTEPVVTQPPVVTPTPEPTPPVVTPPVTQPETPLTDGTLPAGTPIPVPEG